MYYNADQDRYDVKLEIHGEEYLVSFLSFLQQIVYTKVEVKDHIECGSFDVANGYIYSNEPDDKILIVEIENHLKGIEHV